MSKRIISNSTQFSPMPGSEGNLSGTFLFCILFRKINQDLNKSSRKVFICITQIHIYHLTQTPPNFSCLRTVICPCLHWKVFIWKRLDTSYIHSDNASENLYLILCSVHFMEIYDPGSGPAFISWTLWLIKQSLFLCDKN